MDIGSIVVFEVRPHVLCQMLWKEQHQVVLSLDQHQIEVDLDEVHSIGGRRRRKKEREEEEKRERREREERGGRREKKERERRREGECVCENKRTKGKDFLG